MEEQQGDAGRCPAFNGVVQPCQQAGAWCYYGLYTKGGRGGLLQACAQQGDASACCFFLSMTCRMRGEPRSAVRAWLDDQGAACKPCLLFFKRRGDLVSKLALGAFTVSAFFVPVLVLQEFQWRLLLVARR